MAHESGSGTADDEARHARAPVCARDDERRVDAPREVGDRLVGVPPAQHFELRFSR
jgi:hypothetical protein